MSFAPLAGRLAAHAALVRPVDGARDTWAKVVALVMCVLLDMLICVCEALDARVYDVVAAVLVSVPTSRTGRQGRTGESRARCLPSLVREARAVPPRVTTIPCETLEATPTGPRLAWSRDPGLPRRPPSKTRLFDQRLSTLI